MAIYTILKPSKIKDIAHQYGLSPISEITGITEGTVNTYYRFKYENNYYFLKIDEVGDKSRLSKELKILSLLNKAHFDFDTPYPLKNKKQKLFIPFKNKFILIFPAVHGKSISDKDLQPNHLEKMGKVLAELHQAHRKNPLSAHRFNFSEMNRVFKQIKHKLLKKHPHTYDFVKDNLKYLKLNRPQKVPTGLIHADLFPENLLFHKNNISGLLDFEASGKGALLFDIMVTIHACCFEDNKLILKKLSSFLKGYQSIRPITKIEKKNASYYYRESVMRFLLTRLRDFELKPGKVKASPYKDYEEFVDRFENEEKIINSL